MTRLPRAVIKAEAQGRILQVLRALGIAEAPRGASLVICNPVRGEKHPSLQIWIKPGFEGAWKDHGAGLSGDVFDLVAYFNGWDSDGDGGFAKAAHWLACELGLDEGMPPAERKRRADDAARRAAQREAERAGVEREAQRMAKALWLKGHANLAGTPVETYLAARGIDLARLAAPPRAIRYLALHRHRESGRELPCMAACMTDGHAIRAVHRTWLAPDGAAKADVEPQRKIWPAFTGCVIAIARGASGLPVAEASANGIADTLILAEGVEDALTLALAMPEARVWAVGSLSNLAHVPLPDCAVEVLVAVDNDWGKPQAKAALDRGLDHLATFKRPVATIAAPVGKDFNDLVKAR